MPEALFTLERDAYRLEQLEVFNWGPFSGLHRAEFDPQGTAIIGMTGSGKTTLVDAFVTLLSEKPRYNLASTGGHESDRDLVSYVRGVIGSGDGSGGTDHILRKGKTVTGLCATYGDGEQSLRLGALLWLDGTGTGNTDLKRLWIFSRDPEHSLEQWLSTHHDGGSRRLKQLLEESTEEATANEVKRSYLARVRDFFEVGGNAFDLLNRAAGMKQLDSIDMIFRELVLDDHAQFQRAAEVVEGFDRLTEIHGELLTAQRQHRSLIPVEKAHRAHLQCRNEIELQQTLKRLLPIQIAETGRKLWTVETESRETVLSQREAACRQAERDRDLCEANKSDRHAEYLKIGGGDMSDLEKLIQQQEETLKSIQRSADQYRTVCRNFTLDTATDPEAFARNQQRVLALRKVLEKEETSAEEQSDRIGAEKAKVEQNAAELKGELEEAKQRTCSNLPGKYLRFRDELAGELGLTADELPFVAELVEVRTGEQAWRGAIERALGGNRFRILVPTAQLQAALRWVNGQGRHKLHIRLKEAEQPMDGIAKFMPDGFTRKLAFKKHPLVDALKHFLAAHDLHCVDSPDALETTPHGLTREGLVSGRKGYFEKKDQIALDQGWCTGFDNRERVSRLAKECTEAEARLNTIREQRRSAKEALDPIRTKFNLLSDLEALEYAAIDIATAEKELQQSQARHKRLIDPSSDAGKAHAAYEAAVQAFKAADEKLRAASNAESKAGDELDAARRTLAEYTAQAGDGPSLRESELIREHLPLPEDLRAEGLRAYESKRTRAVQDRIEALHESETGLRSNLVRAMGEAKKEDTGALADCGTELEDVPAYLARLQTLSDEALPAKRKQFLDYLNQSSDQGVSTLLATIDNEVAKIRDRIDELNASLRRVDFKENRYLRLDVRDVRHESLRSLQAMLKRLRSAAHPGPEYDGEKHYAVLQEVIALVRDAADNKHKVGARALLDPRYRVEFHGAEIERGTDVVKDHFKGSQGGSGGEKEIIASYILTASLCYALSPEGASRPLHSTIVLDEAFSKSSRTVAKRIIHAVREFGLHPIFVTPDKEMRLLRQHTHSVVNVHRASLTSIRWEELEARAANHRTAAEPTETDEDA